MYSPERLVQSRHLFRMWGSIIALLAIPGFCSRPKSVFECVVASRVPNIPWCFLSLMIFVVAGPMKSRLVRFMAKIAVIGAKASRRLSLAKNPPMPEADDSSGERVPGYVSAITTGSAVCKPK